MRIIAGSWRGRRLVSGRWAGLRPTSDRLRETLFDVLGSRIAGARVVDAYAGTGAIGIEALSRGAAHVTFVERDRRACAAIAANLARCGAPSGCAIIRANFVWAARRRLVPASYDLVVLDPPYDLPRFEPVLAAAARLVRPGGLVVLEHARRRTAPSEGPGLARARALHAGDSALAFYERRNARG
jgi:16S rRNA (guanine966-N2)-methyltransferase